MEIQDKKNIGIVEVVFTAQVNSYKIASCNLNSKCWECRIDKLCLIAAMDEVY